MTRDELTTLVADLKRKLKARENMPGYSQNVKEIKARVASAEQELVALDG